MTAKILRIKSATRFPMDGDYDRLELEEGVNVIVGEMNTGKTKWLQMIDFALGDQGSPEDAFAKELADKYERIAIALEIDGEEIAVERRWREVGAKTKIFVNEEGMTPKQFSEFILGKLNIPLINVPSGNPYGDRTWPELSWRELYRHIYKQESLVRFGAEAGGSRALRVHSPISRRCKKSLLGSIRSLGCETKGEGQARGPERRIRGRHAGPRCGPCSATRNDGFRNPRLH